MNIEKIEEAIQALLANLTEDTFIYDLLIAYGQPRASVTRLQKGDYNLSKVPGELLWKKKLFFKADKASNLYGLIDSKKNDPAILKQYPRFLVVTDFQTILAVDTHTNDSLAVPISDLAKNFDFFLPLAGMEKTQLQSENPADVKAAVRMGKLYDILLEENPPQNNDDRHALNIFLSRLLFCFFAEDTAIFASGQFTNAVASHTVQDGSDLQSYLQKLFKVLNSPERSEYPKFLQAFPYVNGGLFADEYPVPFFSSRSRKLIIECSALNWQAINPDIFGSMMQAVVHDDQRSSLGMHYTSVVNIMKVIKPLFLDNLYTELEDAGRNRKKLEKLLDRLYRLRIFDPACGSGNFLIIAYKELCKLEIEIFKRLHSSEYGNQLAFRFTSKVSLSQFYGIEIDDFAYETAKLSLWLAEHQMNLAFKEVFGDSRPTLPLQGGGNIICGNATRLNWDNVCPKEKECEIYVLGNPPYIGYSNRSREQKADMNVVFKSVGKVKRLDYIGCWFKKASDYIEHANAKYSFVSTNSICQGEQVSLLWPYIYSKEQEILFAWQSFEWNNNAKGKAGVTCVIIGISNKNEARKTLFGSSHKTKEVKVISPYLIEGEPIIISQRKIPVSNFPKMMLGSSGIDGGNLVLSALERDRFLKLNPLSEKFIKPYIGGGDSIKGNERYCLWINDNEVDSALEIPEIKERIEKCRIFRLGAGRDAKKAADVPHRFFYRKFKNTEAIVVPMTSSGKRVYMPVGFSEKGTVVSNGAFVIYDAELFMFGVLSSKMHSVWMSVTSARMRTDYRYSVNLTYNTLPFPEITKAQKMSIEQSALNVLDERERYSEKTIAQLYDPKKMPDGLRQAHQKLDLIVEQCYRSRPFKDDDERLEYLFKLYQETTKIEKKMKDCNAEFS